jgi:Ca2+-transporting ATPase
MLYIPGIIHFFGFQHPGMPQLIICLLTAFVSVIWIEFYKYFKRKKN